MIKDRVAVVGTVGVPGSYGGFETLAQNLVDFHGATNGNCQLSVYCSAKASPEKPKRYGTAQLRYIELDANGPQSIAYDALSLFDAIRCGDNRILLLGVSGALFLPFLRWFSHARIITNVDGIEWKRGKWSWLAKLVLRASEWAAVRFSHRVIADNHAIADYIMASYGKLCDVIPYGGDHALASEPDPNTLADLPQNYALALCRIEPENNVEMILEAFDGLHMPLVFVGNWEGSNYGRALKACYKRHPYIAIHDPVYEPSCLRAIRDRASVYIHGHSAGGTNPSLVEMMHFAIPIMAHGCSFNRYTTEEKASYFKTSAELADAVRALSPQASLQIGMEMQEIARRRYTWDQIGRAYFELLEG